MAEPYLGEIRIMPFEHAPANWMKCDGALLPISRYQALFSLLGVTYGGDGKSTFALPDLRGRVPLGRGTAPLGRQRGEAEHVLLPGEVPGSHSHALTATKATGDQTSAANMRLAGAALYRTPDGTPRTTLHPASVETAGGEPHENRQPYCALNFCIAVAGTYPPRW